LRNVDEERDLEDSRGSATAAAIVAAALGSSTGVSSPLGGSGISGSFPSTQANTANQNIAINACVKIRNVFALRYPVNDFE